MKQIKSLRLTDQSENHFRSHYQLEDPSEKKTWFRAYGSGTVNKVFSNHFSQNGKMLTSSAFSLEVLWYLISPVTRSRASSEASGSMSFQDLGGKARKDILFQSGNVLAS